MAKLKLKQRNKESENTFVGSNKMSVSSSLSISSSASQVSNKTMKTVSLDIDPNTASQTRLYPSVRDYYKSSCVNPSKPIQLQHGLSNYSALILGDDRISFSESILSATYRVAVEDKLTIESPSKGKSKTQRRREYQEAHEKVGSMKMMNFVLTCADTGRRDRNKSPGEGDEGQVDSEIVHHLISISSAEGVQVL